MGYHNWAVGVMITVTMKFWVFSVSFVQLVGDFLSPKRIASVWPNDSARDWVEHQEVYTPCVIAVFFITLPLCFKNLQNTKKFTVVIMWCRFLAITILLIVGVYKSIERFRHENLKEIMLPLWKPRGFVAVFGNSVFLCGIHHYLPSMLPGSLAELFLLNCISVYFYQGCCKSSNGSPSQCGIIMGNPWAPPKALVLTEQCLYDMTRGCHNLIFPNFCTNPAILIW